MMTKTLLPFKVQKTKELITPNGGMSLYLELLRGIKLSRDVRERLPKPGSRKGFSAMVYVTSIVMLFLSGGKYMEDIRKLALDKGLRKVGKIRVIPGADAIGKWLRKKSDEKIKALEIIHRRLSKRFLKEVSRRNHTLDIDAFEIEAEKYTANYTYKSNKGYMPIVGHLAELDWCIGYEFRTGNTSPNARNLEFIKACEKNLPKGHRIKRVRIDSAGHQTEIFRYLDGEGIKFTITGTKRGQMKQEIAGIKETAWQPLRDRDGFKTNRVYAETWAMMTGLEGYFRIVVQRWPNPKRELFEEENEYCYHVVCTNYTREEKTGPEVIHWHNGRAASENYYKEKKYGFNLNYLPCDDHNANAIWFALGLLAYNVHIFAKEHLLPDSWRKKTIQTIRWQLIQVAAKVVKHAGHIWLKFAGVTDEFIEIFNMARMKCANYAGP